MELSSPYLKMVRCLFLSIFYSPKKLKKMLTLHYTAWEKILIVVCRYKLGLYKWINSTGKISKKCKHGSLLCKDIIPTLSHWNITGYYWIEKLTCNGKSVHTSMDPSSFLCAAVLFWRDRTEKVLFFMCSGTCGNRGREYDHMSPLQHTSPASTLCL